MDEEFDKIVGQYRMAAGALLHPLRMYGQGTYVDSILEQFVSLAVQFHQRMSGVDQPFYVEDTHW